MTSKQTITRQEFDDLTGRITALEAKLAALEEKDPATAEDKSDAKGEQVFGDPSQFLNSIVNAAMGAVDEAADALSDLSEKAKKSKPKPEDIPDGIFQILRKAVDVQNHAINRFEESFSAKKKSDKAEEAEEEST